MGVVDRLVTPILGERTASSGGQDVPARAIDKVGGCGGGGMWGGWVGRKGSEEVVQADAELVKLMEKRGAELRGWLHGVVADVLLRGGVVA